VSRFYGYVYGRVHSIGIAPCSVTEHSASEICCCTCGPPGVSQSIKQADTLLQLFCRTVDVDLQASRTEMTVYYTESYSERVGHNRERRQHLRGFGIEKMDNSCC
jgi:hypothetical protein